MARKAAAVELDFAFFGHLWSFYRANRGAIRTYFRELTRKFLDFNDPDKGGTFLRRPQFEALEMYVFLKERLDNKPVHEIFDDWYNKRAPFESRSHAGAEGEQVGLFGDIDEKGYRAAFAQMKKSATGAPYSNYIFALTMGTGKTILMATCIFYEFLLANKFPKDTRYVQNAIVFAPDRTVLQSLREIQSFDRARVVPPEYVNVLNSMITFHFLDDPGATLNVLAKSQFNIIVSNTQKIILKRRTKEPSATEELFQSGKPTYKPAGAFAAAAELYAFEEIDDAEELTTNQRFERLRRLEQLGIYVDEAHHAFGNDLERDLGRKMSPTSLRLTINELAAALKAAGTQVVACYNYTGTPYANGMIFPEVVYSYGLRKAIDNGFLKRVRVTGYTNPKSTEFVSLAIKDFVEHHKKKRFEGMLPKMAFFASTILELQTELRPAVERVLTELGIPASKILVNVGDDSITSNDDLREFQLLDTPASDKQFILLVNKGKEGWNCRSLFGVALYRKPKSKVFVLQATMRCLRAIAYPPQQTGHIYLSDENLAILDEELTQNFRVGLEELREAGTTKKTYQVRVVPPPRKIKLQRIRRLWHTVQKTPAPGLSFDFDAVDVEKYRLLRVEQEGLYAQGAAVGPAARRTTDLTHERERRRFSPLTMVAEAARYLNKSPLEVEKVLFESREGMAEVVRRVNEFNEFLYDHVIPLLFNAFFEIKSFENKVEEEILLVREPEDGFFSVQADPKDVVHQQDEFVARHAAKSFHLDTYCFDSKPEQRFFREIIADARVKHVYFTGMLTHGQSDFYIQYIDPDSHTVRTYYPDFLIMKEEDGWLIVEVKADHQIEDPVVQAKAEYARQTAAASSMAYRVLRASDVMDGRSKSVLES